MGRHYSDRLAPVNHFLAIVRKRPKLPAQKENFLTSRGGWC